MDFFKYDVGGNILPEHISLGKRPYFRYVTYISPPPTTLIFLNWNHCFDVIIYSY